MIFKDLHIYNSKTTDIPDVPVDPPVVIIKRNWFEKLIIWLKKILGI